MTAAAPPAPEVRQSVAQMLTRSEAFRRMDPADQQDIARNTALVANYLAQPEGIKGNAIPGGLGVPAASALADTGPVTEKDFATHQKAVDDIGKSSFKAVSAHEAAAVAGELLNQVKFPTFVSELVTGVFKSITDSSIQQMEAYQNMIASVAKSLHQFADDNISANAGRDHMVDQFPDLFDIGSSDGGDDWGDSSEPRLKLREGVDEAEALKKVNNKLEFQDGQLKSLDLSDDNVEKALVENSRIQLARQRQQMLASIVLMGINRIVVTDGKISAKIMYDVRTQDRLTKRRSASAMDVARDRYGNVQQSWEGSGDYDSGNNTSGKWNTEDYSSDYYAKGTYKYEQKPIITASTSASETSDASMQAKIQLTGAVDVNFKSDYLPLDKMATPQMIASIQGNATPADPNVVPSPRAVAAAAAPASSGGTLAPPPAV
jgi:hypothetical protein